MEGIHHGGSGVLSLNVGQVAGIHHARGELERHGCGEIPKKEKLLFKEQTFSRHLDTCWLPYTMVMGVTMVNMTQPVSVCKSDMQ